MEKDMFIICKKCGKRISDESIFCEHCGATVTPVEYADVTNVSEPVEKRPEQDKKLEEKGKEEKNRAAYGYKKDGAFCIYCGAELPADALFCHRCGNRTLKSNEKDANNGTGSRMAANTTTMDSAKKQMATAAESLSEKIESHEAIKKWGFKVCAVIAMIAIFLPIIDYGFYTMNAVEMIEVATTQNDLPAGIMLGILAVVFNLGLSILMFALTDIDVIRYVATAGTVLLLGVRILPNLIIGASISSETGFGFGYDIVQYGSGWWLMFLPFLAATVESWALHIKEKQKA